MSDRSMTVPLRYRLRGQIATTGRVIVAIIGLAFALLPVLLIATASLDPRDSMVRQAIIPENANFDNYKDLFDNQIHPFGIWLLNTLKIASITSVLTIFICSINPGPSIRWIPG